MKHGWGFQTGNLGIGLLPVSGPYESLISNRWICFFGPNHPDMATPQFSARVLWFAVAIKVSRKWIRTTDKTH